jgi:hypothetical protein
MDLPALKQYLLQSPNWRQDIDQIRAILAEVESVQAQREQIEHARRVIRNLFEIYVKGKGKSFNLDAIVIHAQLRSDSKLYTYHHEGVFIKHHSWVGWKLDDHDTFTDQIVMVDGKIVFESDH